MRRNGGCSYVMSSGAEEMDDKHLNNTISIFIKKTVNTCQSQPKETEIRKRKSRL